jgi:RNA polymerase sigma-70 factor (ECF subfamily)
MSEPGPIGRLELERLYERFGTSILRRATRILADEQLARDVCHDVFVQVLRADSWAPPSPLAWLYVTTTHLCLNVLRGDRRRRLALARLPRSTATVAPVGEAVLLLQRIPPDLQELAVYSAIDQMSQDEIALVLGVSQKTVSNRLHALRALLDPAEPSLNEMRK